MENEKHLADEDDDDIFNFDFSSPSTSKQPHSQSNDVDIFKEIDDCLNDNFSSEEEGKEQETPPQKRIKLGLEVSSNIGSPAAHSTPLRNKVDIHPAETDLKRQSPEKDESDDDESTLKNESPDLTSKSLPQTLKEPKEELDYSILYEGDDDLDNTVVTVGLDELDFSIFDEYSDEDDELQDDTIVHVEPEEPKRKKVKKTTEEKMDLLKMRRDEVKKIYYQKACEIWRKTTSSHVSLPAIYELGFPMVHKDARDMQKIVGYETVGEWADKYHPMHQKFREVRQDNMQFRTLSELVHEEWGLYNSLDIFRNLSKFSTVKKSTQAPAESTKKKFKNTFNLNESYETQDIEAIDGKDIFKVMLQNADDDGSNAVKSLDENVVEKSQQSPEPKLTLAGCKFCTRACTCSPGIRLKRPYQASEFQDKEVPFNSKKFTRHEREQVSNEVHAILTHHMKTMPLGQTRHDHYVKQGEEIVGSIGKAFDLGNFFGSTSLSQEQIREQCSVECTIDKFASYYKKAYRGERPANDEDELDTSDDEAGSEIGSVGDDEDKPSWSQNNIQNY